jgi:hypothetical protein
MTIYNSDNENSGFSLSKIVGAFLALAGAGVVLWTVVEIFQLFDQNSAFIFLDGMVPKQISVGAGDGALYIPRELLVYGIPIWALSVASKIGVGLMKSGLQYLDVPRWNKKEK